MNVALLLLVVIIVVAALCLAGGIVALVLFIISKASRQRLLLEKYSTPSPPCGQVMPRQTVKIGAVVYKRCVTVGIAPEGLYISIRRKTMLIPWHDLKPAGHTMLHWRQIPLYKIGDPPIAALALQGDFPVRSSKSL